MPNSPFSRRCGRWLVLPALFGLILAGAGCQTASLPHIGTPSSPIETAADLLRDARLADADRLYRDTPSAFSGVEGHATLQRLAKAIAEKHAAAANRAQAGLDAFLWPVPQAQWADAADTLQAARTVMHAFDGYAVTANPTYTPKIMATLRQSLNRREQAVKRTAVADLLAYTPENTPDFFAAFPVPLSPQTVLRRHAEAIVRHFEGAPGGDIAAFVKRTPAVRDVAALRVPLAALYLKDAGAAAGSAKAALSRLVAQARAREIGLINGFGTEGPGERIAFSEVTSKTLLRHGQIDFSVAVDVDLPVAFENAPLDELLTSPSSTGPRFVIVFDVALAKNNRRVVDLKEIPSTLFVGYDTKSGPLGATKSNGPRSMNLFAPAATGEPLFQDYRYSKATVQARKAMTATYYVIDRKARTYFQSTFDTFEENHFEVAYNVHRADPRRKRLRAQYDSEKDVDEFEKAPVSVKLSHLLAHYLSNGAEARPFADAATFRKQLLTDKNRVLAKAEANRFDARPLNDPRFDSVVAVYKGKRSMGSGFFVTPDVVLTNWHVVNDAKFVEMKLYNGLETFGRVLAKDARLDIALVESQMRGRPVAFHTGRDLDLGATVEAIGHPFFQEFSITRGIISAIRKEYSINMPARSGHRVLYIQTDAPINGGNSGGPLFLGNKVIGVNTWGIKKSLAEGLNFSIHYAEVLGFLNEHLAAFNVAADGSNP